MTTPIKALFATVATGAMAVAAAVPAMAQIGYGHGYGHGYGNGWNGGNSRSAVEMCSRVAERQASRATYGNARVTDVRDVRGTHFGYEVRGRIAVNTRDHDWNNRGWRNRDFNRDTGSFTCRFERDRISYLDFDGIRGL
ncbi:MAG: hypothetical protein ABIM50_09785 [Novosphingobium sp.]